MSALKKKAFLEFPAFGVPLVKQFIPKITATFHSFFFRIFTTIIVILEIYQIIVGMYKM